MRELPPGTFVDSLKVGRLLVLESIARRDSFHRVIQVNRGAFTWMLDGVDFLLLHNGHRYEVTLSHG